MYLEQISLVNSQIRLALRKGDSKTISESILRLCKGSREKADRLTNWFSQVAISCNKNKGITMDMSMMRMWQLGNMDIQEITESGKPSFVLTVSGTEKISATPKEKWFEVLLWNDHKQLTKGS